MTDMNETLTVGIGAEATIKMNVCSSVGTKSRGSVRRFSTPSVPTDRPQCCVWAYSSPTSSCRSSLDCGHTFHRQLSLVEFPKYPPTVDRWKLQVPQHASSDQDRSDASTEIDTSGLSIVSSETARRVAEQVSGSYQLLPNGSATDRPGFWRFFVSPRPVWRSILLGQVLSLLVAIRGGVNGQCLYVVTHASFGFFGFRIVAHYVLLCLVFMAWAVVRPSQNGVLPSMCHRCGCYLLLALTDVECHYLSVITAYYTSILGVQVLNSAAVPAAMVISCIALDVNYKTVHFLGALLCFAGLACNAWANFRNLGGSDNGLGVVLGLAGAVLQSIVVVSEEYAVKVSNWAELLGMLGLFGTIIATLQVWLFLGLAVVQEGLVVEVTQVVSHLLFQCLSLLVLKDSGATAMLLSLFTVNMYLPFTSLLVCHFLHFTGTVPVQVLHEFKMDSRHYLALLLVLSGLLVYSVKRTPILSEHTDAYRVSSESSTEGSTLKEPYRETTPLRRSWNKH